MCGGTRVLSRHLWLLAFTAAFPVLSEPLGRSWAVSNAVFIFVMSPLARLNHAGPKLGGSKRHARLENSAPNNLVIRDINMLPIVLAVVVLTTSRDRTLSFSDSSRKEIAQGKRDTYCSALPVLNRDPLTLCARSGRAAWRPF